MKIISSSFIAFVFLPYFSYSTLSKSDRKFNKQDKKMNKLDKFRNEMISKDFNGNSSINYRSIIEEHKSFSVSQSIISHFSNEVLAYVTPWNGHGYDIAKLFPSKFTMVSPVWLQLRPRTSNGDITIQGLHDIDSNWIQSVRNLNKDIKIVPRIIFEQWSYQTLKKLFLEKAAVENACSKLLSLAKDKKFNGYVVEIWNMLGGHMKREVTNFIIDVSSVFQEHDLDLILVIPPPLHSGGQKGIFLREDFLNLVDHVTGFSLMTYDYSNPQRPGPNSPLPWLLQCVDELVPDGTDEYRRKILLGLNFYGYDYSKTSHKPVVGHEYISLLEKHKPKFHFNNITGEHSFTYKLDGTDHIVFYPTLYSIQLRLQLARDLGTSISIWEIGQGLDYFFDLL